MLLDNKKKILVIGESCSDLFVYCDALRLAPDIPVPVLNVLNSSENPGMAKNVYRNIKSIHDKCDLLTNDNWYSITKTRYMHEKSNHMFFRVDAPHLIDRINLKKIIYDYEIIVISDYDKGFLTTSDIKTISEMHDNVFLDTKKILGPWAKKCKYIKINDYEYMNSIDFIDNDLKNKIIHTKGAEGCYFKKQNYPVDKVEVKDLSGAGDSFMAALVCEFLKSKDIISSIEFANLCASNVVKNKGVGVI